MYRNFFGKEVKVMSKKVQNTKQNSKRNEDLTRQPRSNWMS